MIAWRRYRQHQMLKCFRTRASAIAPLLLLSLASLALPHANDNHDADGAFALLVVHDASGHGVGAPASEEADPGHCAICHLSRPFPLLSFSPSPFPSSLSSSCWGCL